MHANLEIMLSEMADEECTLLGSLQALEMPPIPLPIY